MQETYSDEFATRVETQAEAAKRHLKTAYESGDPEAMAEAQQLLAKAEADRNALAQYQRDLEQYKIDYAAWLEQQESDQKLSIKSKDQRWPATILCVVNRDLNIKNHQPKSSRVGYQ